MISKAFYDFYNEGHHNIPLLEEKEGIIKHLTHLEELILTRKKQGYTDAVTFINELVKVFDGNTTSSIFTTVKYDGSPSIIAGYNPENNNFFVATKGLAAKTPKINYTDKDIELNHGHAPGLVKKLKLALKYLPAVIKQGLYQGDFMYDRDEVKHVTYEGEKLLTFKPNTITYAVPTDSELGKRIINSQIGIIFHTRLAGELGQLQKSPDVNATEFNETREVLVDDAKFKDMTGTVTLTDDEKAKIVQSLKQTDSAANSVDWNEIPEGVYTALNTFINTLIRSGRFVVDPDNEFVEFVNWYTPRLEAPIQKLKTESGRAKAIAAKDAVLAKIDENKMHFVNIFFITQKLEEIKKIFINKYNSAIKTRQFIAQPDGTLKVTAPEGYVAVDHLGNMVKLVDRLEFSRANFSISREDKFK